MPDLAQSLNYSLATLTVIGQIAIVIIAASLIFKRSGWLQRWKRFLMPLAFIAALLAMLGSLAYSDLLGYNPCKLCWYQRIAMYPQVLILGLAWWKKDAGARLYAISLSLIGAAIALYHYLLQLNIVSSSSCAVVKTVAGFSVSCSDKAVLLYGYITIPLMALTAFLLIIMTLLLDKKLNGK